MSVKKTQNWDQSVRKYLTAVSTGSTEAYEVDGLVLHTDPEVFPAQVFLESIWFARRIARMGKGKRMLEIGTGTGIVALLAAQNGAIVSATDINPAAIRNARANAERNGLSISIYEGSVYEPIPEGEKYDLIFWNHPFNKGDRPETEVLMCSVFDEQYLALEEYISRAERFLVMGGKLLLGTGSIADLEEIERIAHKQGYELALLDRVEAPSEVDGSIPNDYRIYILK